MPLTWSTANVANRQEVDTDPHDEKSWHPVCFGIVMLSMNCGYNAITEKNWEEVAQRIAVWQHIFGAYLGTRDDEVYITVQDVRRYIGLTTNASTMTKTQFNKRVAQWMMEEAPNHIRKQFNRNGSKTALEVCAKTETTEEGATA